jgi:hypothetical protein
MPRFLSSSQLGAVIADGVYALKVTKATEKVSERGNPMIVMALCLPDGRFAWVCSQKSEPRPDQSATTARGRFAGRVPHRQCGSGSIAQPETNSHHPPF